MTNQNQKYAEAVAALTHRLGAWGVDDPADKARGFMHDLARQGWRAIRPEVAPPAHYTPTSDPTVKAAALAAARAALPRATPAPPTDDNDDNDDSDTEETA